LLINSGLLDGVDVNGQECESRFAKAPDAWDGSRKVVTIYSTFSGLSPTTTSLSLVALEKSIRAA